MNQHAKKFGKITNSLCKAMQQKQKKITKTNRKIKPEYNKPN